MEEQLWSVARTARWLGVTERSVYRWIDAGKLRALHAGRAVRLHPDDVAEFVGRGEGLDA